jgi:hypothetical protein
MSDIDAINFSYTTNEENAPISIIIDGSGDPELLISSHHRIWLIRNRKAIASIFCDSYNELLDEVINTIIEELVLEREK